jgi:Ca-activated chloride channel homolog
MTSSRVARLCAWLAVAAVVVAAAEPSIETAPAARVGILVLVVDRSGSTAADDLAPTRLDAIRQATLALLDRVPERVRVGLVAFSDKPETLARPTTDRDAVRAGVASLSSYGGTAVGDALRHALHEIEAASGAGSRSASPAAPAAVLLISDGASSSGSDPLDAARLAAGRHVQVFGVAVGTPGGLLIRRERNFERRQPVPPDPALLHAIAGPTGGHAVEARSTPALHAALEDLGRDLGVPGEPTELTMLFGAAALLLLAVGSVLSPRRRGPAGARTAPPAVVRRLAPPVALLAAAGGAAVAWAQLPPAGAPPARPPATGTAASLAVAAPSRPPPPPPFVTIDAAGGRDRTTIRQAVALLRRHRELADQRRAEIDRRGLNRIEELHVSACDVCGGERLTGTPTVGFISGRTITCNPKVNTPVLRKTARRADLPASSLAAMVILYEQELCLHERGEGSPFAAGLRLARKLGAGRLLDVLYAQIDAARADDWLAVEQGVALLRQHGELGAQRWEQLGRQRGRNQVWPLQIQVCRGCLFGRQGLARSTPETDGTVSCDIRVDLAVVERAARGWGLPRTQLVASLLAHEQGHCIHHPDDREIPAIDEERRLARKLGSARQLEYVDYQYGSLDGSGHWKD